MKEIIFYGDDAFFYEFPEDIDIYYAKPPITPIKNQELAIEHAIKNPINSPKLPDLINSNSTIAICFDDISVPLPPMKNEVRKIAAEVVLKIFKEIGVKDENLYFVCATGLHRKCKPKELKQILGKKLYRKYKNHIFNHDAEDEINLKTLGIKYDGDEIKINKLAAEADLIIYLNISFVPLNGGWKSIIVGLGSYNTIITHHSPQTLKQGSFMDPESSELHQIIWEMGDLIKNKLKVFTIEMVVNNNFYSGIYKRIYKPIKSTQRKIPLWRRFALSALISLPKFIKAYVRKNLKANYEMIDVFAGNIVETHEKSLVI